MRCAPLKKSVFGHTIIIQTIRGTVYAYVLGQPDISGVGQNEAGALGDLVFRHGPKLGISIVRHD